LFVDQLESALKEAVFGGMALVILDRGVERGGTRGRAGYVRVADTCSYAGKYGSWFPKQRKHSLSGKRKHHQYQSSFWKWSYTPDATMLRTFDRVCTDDRTKDKQGKSVWDLLLPTLRNTRYEVCSEKYRALNELLKYLMVRQKMPTHILRVLNFNRVYTGTLQVGTRIRRNLVYLAASRDRVLQNINIPEETHDIINSFVGMNFQE
jgi:hypothetical protein